MIVMFSVWGVDNSWKRYRLGNHSVSAGIFSPNCILIAGDLTELILKL